MRNYILLCALLLCLIFTSCNVTKQSDPTSTIQTNQTVPSTDVDIHTPSDLVPSSVSTDDKTYIEAYTDFLLDSDIDANHDTGFPIRGYYLFDLNFDDIPELGVLHDSMGSMGGYFTYYRFDGKGIVPITNNENSPISTSNYTQVLADSVNKKVYFLKEMYLLQGNENGKSGYLRELIIQDGVMYVYNILDLEVNQASNLAEHIDKKYYYEDEFLSDAELDECLITQHYSSGEWKDISSAEYLKHKKELIPADNTFMDLRDTAVSYVGAAEDMMDESDGLLKNIRITSEEIDALFSKWLKHPTSASIPLPTKPVSPSPEPIVYHDIDDLEFGDLSDMVFWFSGGAGAWATSVEIMPDGTFSGLFNDSNMGETGEGYPDGTVYYCSFSGRFSLLEKTGAYEYSMKCESLVQEGTPGEEMIADGRRYIVSEPYGFDDADMFSLYLPGKKVNELPGRFLEWVSMPRVIDFNDVYIFDFWGLYNVTGEQGFSCDN